MKDFHFLILSSVLRFLIFKKVTDLHKSFYVLLFFFLILFAIKKSRPTSKTFIVFEYKPTHSIPQTAILSLIAHLYQK